MKERARTQRKQKDARLERVLATRCLRYWSVLSHIVGSVCEHETHRQRERERARKHERRLPYQGRGTEADNSEDRPADIVNLVGVLQDSGDLCGVDVGHLVCFRRERHRIPVSLPYAITQAQASSGE